MLNSNFILDPFDILILKSFLFALTKLTTSLPISLCQEINEVGHALAKEQNIIAKLEDIAHRNPELKQCYETAYLKLQKNYKTQELVRPQQRENAESQRQILLDNVLIATLTEIDPKAGATERREQIKLEYNTPSPHC